MDKKILFCCGAGMSSGLIAQKVRKASRKRGTHFSVQAVSQSEISQYIDSTDLLLIGPHYVNRLSDFEKQAEPYHVPVKVIPNQLYGTLNGDGVLDLIIDTLSE